MIALHTLGILSTNFMRNAFQTVLKEFPHMLSTCWLLFLHSAVHHIPNHLNWVEVRWLWRPGHLTQQSITLLLGQIALTQPGGVFGHCPLEKQMIVPTRWDSLSLRNAVVAMLVKFILNKSLTVSPATHPNTKHPHTMLHGGTPTCRDHPFTYSASHKDTAVGTKILKFGLIRAKDRFPKF